MKQKHISRRGEGSEGVGQQSKECQANQHANSMMAFLSLFVFSFFI